MPNKNRLNSGMPGELPLLHEGLRYENPDSHTLEEWNIHDRGADGDVDRWKLCAAPGCSVLGHANYAVKLKAGSVIGGDNGWLLKGERLGLFAAVELIAQSGVVPGDELYTPIEDDPYGDIAESQQKTLSRAQQWNRALLKMRETHLHWECRIDSEKMKQYRAPSWENAIRQAWYGIFKGNFDRALQANQTKLKMTALESAKLHGHAKPHTEDYTVAINTLLWDATADMSETMREEAVAFITQVNGPVSAEAYNQVVADYYDGKYKPNAHKQLEEYFDFISGVGDEPGKREDIDFSELL